jgi:hypothetical protein
VRLKQVLEHPHTEVYHAFVRGDQKFWFLKISIKGRMRKPPEITGELPVKEVAAFTGGDPITDWVPRVTKVVDKVVKGVEVETPSGRDLLKPAGSQASGRKVFHPERRFCCR